MNYVAFVYRITSIIWSKKNIYRESNALTSVEVAIYTLKTYLEFIFSIKLLDIFVFNGHSSYGGRITL